MDLKCFDIIGFVIILKRFPFFIISAGGVFIVKMVHSEVCGLSCITGTLLLETHVAGSFSIIFYFQAPQLTFYTTLYWDAQIL